MTKTKLFMDLFLGGINILHIKIGNFLSLNLTLIFQKLGKK